MNFENIKQQKNDFPSEISIGDFKFKLKPDSIKYKQKQHNYDLKNAFDSVAAGACDQILIPVGDKVAIYIKVDN